MTNTKSNTSISVVIPVFNAEQSIQETLTSVLNQDYKNYNVHVVDDGSTDKTVVKIWEMREKFIEEGVKLHVISQKNTGVSSARNRGVAASSGEYIAFLDADDKWLPNKLNEHAVMMDEQPHVGVSFARVAYISSDKKQHGKLSMSYEQPMKVMDMLDFNPTVSPSNWVVRRSAFNAVSGFKDEMSHAEDQDFIIRLIAHSDYTVESIRQCLTQYVTSENGLSADLHSMYEGWQYLVNAIQASKFELSQNEFSRLHSNYCWYLARRSWQVKSNPKVGVQYCWKAITTDNHNIIVQPVTKLKIIAAVVIRLIFPVRIESKSSKSKQLNQSRVTTEVSHV